MLIDWFTVGAQIINFLILVWLLKSFLYKPVLTAIEKRERSIRDSLDSAARMKREAEEARREFEQRNADIARQQQAYLDQARDLAEAERLRLVEAARTQTESQQAKWRESLAAEEENLRNDLAREAQDEIIGIARQALSDLAGADLEERMADRFIKQIEHLDEEDRERLIKAAQETAGASVVIQSSKLIPATIRQQIEAGLTQMLGRTLPFRFETSGDTAQGVVLTLGGYRLSWTLQEYLETLQKAAAKHLTEDRKEEGIAG